MYLREFSMPLSSCLLTLDQISVAHLLVPGPPSWFRSNEEW